MDEKKDDEDIIEITLDEKTTWSQVDLEELPYPTNSWLPFFETQKEHLKIISNNIKKIANDTEIYPLPNNVFRAFELCDFKKVKVILCGMDPYHVPGRADGLAFSCTDIIQPSLANMFEEMNLEGFKNPNRSPKLDYLAKQNVFLINLLSLTVSKGKAGSHARFGWSDFVWDMMLYLRKRKNLVYILFGRDAESYKGAIDAKNNLIIIGPHCSPLAAYRCGFFNRSYFVDCNEYLKKHGKKGIKW